MREIKFRAWDYKNDKMRDWEDVARSWTMFELNRWDKQEWMQYTGLKDKNGNEIFEGDVVRILYTDWTSNPAPNNEGLEEYKKSISDLGHVVWEDNRWELNFGKGRFGEDVFGRLSPGPHGEMEIIGNIYENPELLTKH